MSLGALERLRGRFLVLDGIDGAGKGAQIARITSGLEECGVPFVAARDPGGTVIGDRIRHVLLDYDLSGMDPACEALLFMASRAQLLGEVIRPALADRKAVICDRFVSATCAYQGAAGFEARRAVELARFAVGDCWPHLTIVLDVPPAEGAQRTGRPVSRAGAGRRGDDAPGQVRLFHDAHADAMERRPPDFHERVRANFLELPAYYPAPVAVVDGRGDVEAVHQRVLEAIERAAF